VNEKYKIHVCYIISFLIFTNIILVAVEWSKIPNLMEYISFALTLSSLLLAILAIIYSIISNTSLTKVMHNIDSTSNSLKTTSDKIELGHKNLLSEVKKIPNSIDIVDQNVNSTKSLIEHFALKKNKTYESENFDLSDEHIQDFIDNSSLLGLYSLLCLSLSFTTKTSFRYEHICDSDESLKKSLEYFNAYFVSASANKMFSFKFDGQERFIITRVHPVILNKIDTHIVNLTNDILQDFADSEVPFDRIEKRWFRPYNSIKSYFIT